MKIDAKAVLRSGVMVLSVCLMLLQAGCITIDLSRGSRGDAPRTLSPKGTVCEAGRGASVEQRPSDDDGVVRHHQEAEDEHHPPDPARPLVQLDEGERRRGAQRLADAHLQDEEGMPETNIAMMYGIRKAPPPYS